MTQRSSIKRSHSRLKQLIDATVAEEFKLHARGLSFFVDELEVSGRPPEHLKVWATVHFLRLGSPFCCMEPMCHVPLFAESLDRLNDSVRRIMGLRQQVSLEFVSVGQMVHNAVEFDDPFTGRCPAINSNDIDQRDALGRTALMRAAVRGRDRLVEELLAAGASSSVVDDQGRGILEQVRAGQMWIRSMLESALAQRDRTTH